MARLEATHLAQPLALVRAPAELDLVVPDHHRCFVRHRALDVLEHRLGVHLVQVISRGDKQATYMNNLLSHRLGVHLSPHAT